MQPITSSTESGFCQGRRVLDSNQTPYIMTKSGEEVDRLNLQHWLIKKYLGANFFAPVKRPHMILDVACGTGIWGREVARHFKQAQVWNIDIDRKWLDQAEMNLAPGAIPPNFHFRQGNVLEGLPWRAATFDYVHSRFIFSFVHITRWPSLIAEMVRVLRPGGWLGIFEADVPTGGGPLYQGRRAAGERFLLQRLGSLEAPQLLGTWLCEAGLHEITTQQISLRIPENEPALRRALVEDMMKSLRGIAPLLSEAGLLTDAQRREEDLPALQAELEQTDITTTIYIAYGRRPRHIDG